MITYGSKIPLNGIRTYWDAGNPLSYPSGSTTWTDLIQGSTMTLTASTGSTEYPSILFGNSGGAVEDVGIDRRYDPYTIIVVSRMQPGGGDIDGRILQAKTNNWFLGHHSTNYGAYYAGNWVINQPSNTTGTDEWRMYVGQGNYSEDVWSYWANQSLIVDKSTNGIVGPIGLAIGGVGYTNQYTDCEVGLILDYSRWLSPDEIVSIFKNFRGRYNI